MYYRAIACILAVRVCVHGSSYLDIFMPDLEQATLKLFVTHEVASRNLVLVCLFDFSYSVFTDGIIWTSSCQIWIKLLWDLPSLMTWHLDTSFWFYSAARRALLFQDFCAERPSTRRLSADFMTTGRLLRSYKSFSAARRCIRAFLFAANPVYG